MTENGDTTFSGPEPAPSGSELIILGSGSSTGVPSPICLLRPTVPPCAVCHSAMALPPEVNKNYRCNPSLLIKYVDENEQCSYIQIDAGKTFREQVLRWYLQYNIPRLDSLILTHEHADAVLGLDDIRGVQPYNLQNDITPMPVFLSQHTMTSISEKFPYLVQKQGKPGQEIRRVAQLDWQVIETSCDKPFMASGLEVVPLPVMHGEDYVSLGFSFGKQARVVYISDVSRIPDETERVIVKAGVSTANSELGNANSDMLPVSLLIIDCLYKNGHHNTHFCLADSLAAIKRLRPKRALLIGMTHEFDHDTDNAALRAWSQREGLDVQLAYDGMRIPIDL